jgi:hypothetical protein
VAAVEQSIWRVRGIDVKLHEDYSLNAPLLGVTGAELPPLLFGGKSYNAFYFHTGGQVYSAPEQDLREWREENQGYYLPGWRQMHPVTQYSAFPALKPRRLHLSIFHEEGVPFSIHLRRTAYLERALAEWRNEHHELILHLDLDQNVMRALRTPMHPSLQNLLNRCWVANAEAQAGAPYGCSGPLLQHLGVATPNHNFWGLHITWW